MRLVSTLLLIALVFTVLSPTPALNPCTEFGETTIEALDVCHSAAPIIDPELPYISAYACTPLPLRLAGVHEPFHSSIKPVLFAYQDERPPKSLS
jgi:hypothetical protein